MSKELIISSRESLKKTLRAYHLDKWNMYDIFKNNVKEQKLWCLYHTSGNYILHMNNDIPEKIMIGEKHILLGCIIQKGIKRESSFILEREGKKSSLFWELWNDQESSTPEGESDSTSSGDVLTF